MNRRDAEDAESLREERERLLFIRFERRAISVIMTHGKTSLLFEELRGKIGADTLPPPLESALRGKTCQKRRCVATSGDFEGKISCNRTPSHSSLI
jgi:hypothetical protein